MNKTITSEDGSKGVSWAVLADSGMLSPEEIEAGPEVLFTEHSMSMRDMNRNPTLNVPSKPYKITKIKKD